MHESRIEHAARARALRIVGTRCRPGSSAAWARRGADLPAAPAPNRKDSHLQSSRASWVCRRPWVPKKAIGWECSRCTAPLAAALAEMISEGEVNEAQALQLAHGYLHDNAVGIYQGKVH